MNQLICKLSLIGGTALEPWSHAEILSLSYVFAFNPQQSVWHIKADLFRLCSNAAHYLWLCWGYQSWLSVFCSGEHESFMRRGVGLSEMHQRRDCVALTGTQRIETCLKGWGIEFYFLTAEWPFGSQGGRDRDGFRSSSALLSAAPPTGLRINAPLYLSAEQGDSSWTAPPSAMQWYTRGEKEEEKKKPYKCKWLFSHELEQLKKIHMNQFDIWASRLVHLHCSSGREEAGTTLNLSHVRTVQESRAAHPHSKLRPVLTDARFSLFTPQKNCYS